MDPRVFRRVQRYGWDAATDAYERGWVPLIEGLTESCVARAALQPGERVLDLATGTGVGAFAASLAERIAEGSRLLSEATIDNVDARDSAPWKPSTA